VGEQLLGGRAQGSNGGEIVASKMGGKGSAGNGSPLFVSTQEVPPKAPAGRPDRAYSAAAFCNHINWAVARGELTPADITELKRLFGIIDHRRKAASAHAPTPDENRPDIEQQNIAREWVRTHYPELLAMLPG
jgi:hypothetical protein